MGRPFGSDETERIVNELPYILSQDEAVYQAPAWSRLSDLICQNRNELLISFGNGGRAGLISYKNNADYSFLR